MECQIVFWENYLHWRHLHEISIMFSGKIISMRRLLKILPRVLSINSVVITENIKV